MRFDALAEQRHRILLDIKDRFVIVGPDEIGFGVGNGVGCCGVGRQILYFDCVLPATDKIFGIGQQSVIGADLAGAYGKVVLPFCHLRLVEHDFFRRA